MLNSYTWSVKHLTVLSYDATRDASTVAPPYAEFQSSVREVLYVAII